MKNISLYNNVSRLALCIFLSAGLNSIAHANDADKISQRLTDWLKDGSYTYDTQAHTYKTDSRYVFAGGEYAIRTPNYRTNPISISLPSFHRGTGCGGIDLYMGSFSFLTKDELKNFVKSVSKGAPIYAFNLALENYAPDIYNNVEKLRNITNMLSNTQLDACTTAQYGVNSIASIFDENVANKVKKRTIQYEWETLNGADNKDALVAPYIAEYKRLQDSKDNASTTGGSSGSGGSGTYEDKDVSDILASSSNNPCGIASDNLDAMTNPKGCKIENLAQAQGYEKTGEFGNIMRLTSQEWIKELRTKELFKNTPLFPQSMTNKEIREFVYSLFGTSFTTFSSTDEAKCVANAEKKFETKPGTITATILMDGGNINLYESNNPNNTTSNEYCFLIDTDFKERSFEWKSPIEPILKKLGNFKNKNFLTESGSINTDSQEYKELSQTIIGNQYFSDSSKKALRAWTDEEDGIISMMPASIQTAISNKEVKNSPKLVYSAAEACIRPIVAKAYKDLLNELKDVLEQSMNNYVSGLSQDNKNESIKHLESQHLKLTRDLDNIIKEKDPDVCANEKLGTKNITVNTFNAY